MSRLILPQCAAVEHTDVGNYPFRCELDTGHPGTHQHTFPRIGLFTWTDTPKATVTDLDRARWQKIRDKETL